MIEIRSLTKRYGEKTVYENFDLTLEEGKITCLLGKSGCGKTTLLNAIAGLIPYEGDIPKLKVSYVFQTPRLVPNLTLEDNLKLICPDGEKIARMLERVGLADRAKVYPINLSGGEAQRAAIARAFLFDSDILLMDEPFASLDLKLKARISELFFEVWKEDKRTVLCVTHDIDEAVVIAQRALVLAEGRIIYDSTPESPVPRKLDEGGELRSGLVRALLK